MDVFIESDASLLGWGTSHNRKSAQGRRSMLEVSNYKLFRTAGSLLWVASICGQSEGCSCLIEAG